MKREKHRAAHRKAKKPRNWSQLRTHPRYLDCMTCGAGNCSCSAPAVAGMSFAPVPKKRTPEEEEEYRKKHEARKQAHQERKVQRKEKREAKKQARQLKKAQRK